MLKLSTTKEWDRLIASASVKVGGMDGEGLVAYSGDPDASDPEDDTMVGALGDMFPVADIGGVALAPLDRWLTASDFRLLSGFSSLKLVKEPLFTISVILSK